MVSSDHDSRIRLLEVRMKGRQMGQLLKDSQYEFRYLVADNNQAPVGLLMPPHTMTWRSAALFPVMDQNLPEGDLFNRLRQWFPKQEMTAMRLLAMIGFNGIGRLGYQVPGQDLKTPGVVSRDVLLRLPYTDETFNELVAAYLSTGIGVSGMQPKILVSDRITMPIPNLIVKTGASVYPGLAANEFLCMRAAATAGIQAATVDLTDDGGMLLVDRFDILPDGTRLGFEDVASLMGLHVRDTLADRKYHGSYQRVAELLAMVAPQPQTLARFFEQLAFSVMVGNGDAHLKNFAVLYNEEGFRPEVWLSPLFDVVSTRIYRYRRSPGGPELEDNTMALRLLQGAKNRSKAYPLPAELASFGTRVCGVREPFKVFERLAQAMSDTLAAYRYDARIPRDLVQDLEPLWQRGMRYGMS
ncbi:MAG: type II toxin-antitoxin system HipA family toxin [Pigmentiphaga sp.]|nr:type II toxin-antitoxin system HipA family toxin [Pigmentiphaga sp.]